MNSLLAFALALTAPLADPRPGAPNIVLIISDDQAFTDYGFIARTG